MNLPINMRLIKYKIWKILQKSMYATFKRNAPKRVLDIFPNSNSAEYLNQIKDISEIDRNVIGRYCGSLKDKVMQTMSCFDIAQKFPSNPKYAHVEIGVLFGGSILAKSSILKRLKINQTIIAIDPFEGYYQQGNDPSTNLEVSEANFRKNLENFCFSNNIKIIKKYSTDQDIKLILKNYKIVSLMIGDKGWPDVIKFVDKMIALNDPNWKKIGELDTTLIMQRS